MTAVQTDYNNIAAFYEDKWTSFLHPAREWTLERITNTAFSKPINIIDLGCGTGAFLQSLRHCQPDALLTGIDTSSAMLVQAQMRFKGDKDTTLEQSDIENFNMDDEIYDVVSCHYVLHHIKRQKEFISKMIKAAKPGGDIFIADYTIDSLPMIVGEIYWRLFLKSHHKAHSGRRLANMLEQFANIRILEKAFFAPDRFWRQQIYHLQKI